MYGFEQGDSYSEALWGPSGFCCSVPCAVQAGSIPIRTSIWPLRVFPWKMLPGAADLMMAMDWPTDLKPLEEVGDFFRSRIVEEGEVLYAE